MLLNWETVRKTFNGEKILQQMTKLIEYLGLSGLRLNDGFDVKLEIVG